MDACGASTRRRGIIAVYVFTRVASCPKRHAGQKTILFFGIAPPRFSPPLDWPDDLGHRLADAARGDQLARVLADEVSARIGRRRTCASLADHTLLADWR